MSETKFTPGPWENQGEDHFADMPFVRVGKGYRPIADAIPPIDLVDLDEETRANANLIAAAPELYAILQDAWFRLDQFAFPDLCGRILDALAKARGEA